MNDLSKARATTLEVGEEAAAQRIDNFLLRHLKGVPKSHVYRVLRSGEVRVNSGRVKPEYPCSPATACGCPRFGFLNNKLKTQSRRNSPSCTKTGHSSSSTSRPGWRCTGAAA
jgi:hypothetical protein